MGKVFSIPGQILMYSAFGLVIGWFATMPQYRYADPGIASIKVSLSHAADRIEPCVQLTPEQIAELAMNMRQTEACERERLPLYVEIDIDGRNVFSLESEPTGLWNDGPSSVYERFDVAPGTHTITARLRDTDREDGWDYEKTDNVVLEAGRYFTVTFKAETGGFNFR
jgi:hypothetical protein